MTTGRQTTTRQVSLFVHMEPMSARRHIQHTNLDKNGFSTVGLGESNIASCCHSVDHSYRSDGSSVLKVETKNESFKRLDAL
jgi:hypothetical protein